MTITSVGAPVNGLSSYTVNAPMPSNTVVPATSIPTESSQVHLSTAAKTMATDPGGTASAITPSAVEASTAPKQSSSWLDDALDSILPDDKDDEEIGNTDPKDIDDDCTCTVGKYLKAAATIGSVIALFA